MNDQDLLGLTVQDKLTGFTGVCSAVIRHISGCVQGFVAPKVDKDGKYVEGSWFDVQRLSILHDARMILDNAQTPGPSAPVPTSRMP